MLYLPLSFTRSLARYACPRICMKMEQAEIFKQDHLHWKLLWYTFMMAFALRPGHGDDGNVLMWKPYLGDLVSFVYAKLLLLRLADAHWMDEDEQWHYADIAVYKRYNTTTDVGARTVYRHNTYH